jgi:uncharacterized membrane protein
MSWQYNGFSILDAMALGFFGLAWLGYHTGVESSRWGGLSLNAIMNQRRHAWFMQSAKRDNRIVDTQIMNGLQNGTAFFASTSLLAIGGSTALLQSTDQLMQVFRDLSFIQPPAREALEMKIIGLAVIFAYAFFKFSWSYRLFNYGAVLLGTMPGRVHGEEEGTAAARAALDKAMGEAAWMNVSAGRHFNRGQRAFLFAIAYLGWFLGPLFFLATTAGVLLVMWNRQFNSDARKLFF